MSDGLSVKELGETEDPKQLVPGEAGQVRAAATAFGDEGRHMTRVHGVLSGLSAPAWEGAAADAFNASYPPSLTPWTEVADDLAKVETALGDHAGVLTSAQDKAQQAITKWKEGEQRTQEALASHNQAVREYNAAATRPVPTIGGGGGGAVPPMPGPFVDPGAALQREAQEILAQAREQVTASVTTTGEALITLPGALTAGELPSESEVGNTTIDGDAFSILGEDPPWQDDEQMTPWGDAVDADGDGRDDETGVDISMELGSLEGPSGSVASAEGMVTDQYGNVTATAGGSAQVLGYESGASASLGSDGLQASANAGAYLAQAEGSASLEAGPASVTAEGSAMVGAEGEASASIGPEGLHAGGEVFAGARAEGGVSGEVGGIGAGVTGEAWAGVGASADVDVGMNDDGSFTIGGHFGAALGVGGQIGGEITIDPGEVVDTAQDIGEGIADGVESAGDAIGDAASGIGDALGF